MTFMHVMTGAVATKEGWISSYSPEELEERGFTNAEEAFTEDEGKTLVRVEKINGHWVEVE